MTPERLEAWKLHCRVLCPIHVGTGDLVEPVELTHTKGASTRFYRLRPDAIVPRFDEQSRIDWQKAMTRTDFREMRRILVRNCRPPRPETGDKGDTRYPIEGWGDFLQFYATNMQTDEGLYEIQETQRNADGSLRVPGSTIKGAVRTAVAEHRLKQMKTKDGDVYFEGEPFRPGERDFKALEAVALGCARRTRRGPIDIDIDRDPFRALHVRDAAIPAAAGRLVCARNRSLKRADEKSEGVPMQLEVIAGKALGEDSETAFSIEFALDDHAREQLRGAGVEPLTIGEIQQAVHVFFWGRRQQELRTFAGFLPPFLRKPDFWALGQADNGALNEFYFRLGRFSHVECLSVEDYRRVQPPPKGRFDPARKQGGARTLVDGSIPFGWMACRLEKA